jgi:hypothetical protein
LKRSAGLEEGGFAGAGALLAAFWLSARGFLMRTSPADVLGNVHYRAPDAGVTQNAETMARPGRRFEGTQASNTKSIPHPFAGSSVLGDVYFRWPDAPVTQNAKPHEGE